MKKKKTERCLLQAATIKEIAIDEAEIEFWTAYIQGLQRYYHGPDVDTEEYHEETSSIPNDTLDLALRGRGEGYRAGLSGQDPVKLYKEIQNYLTIRELIDEVQKLKDKKNVVGAQRIYQLAPQIPCGRKTRFGWMVPKSAFDFILQLPGTGTGMGSEKKTYKTKGKQYVYEETMCSVSAISRISGKKYNSVFQLIKRRKIEEGADVTVLVNGIQSDGK